MVIDADQRKKFIGRKVIEEASGVSLELVEFQTEDGPAFGCRVFSNLQSATSDLYDNPEEAIAVGRVGWEKSAYRQGVLPL